MSKKEDKNLRESEIATEIDSMIEESINEETAQENLPATSNPMPGMLAGNQEDLFKSKMMAMWTTIPTDKPGTILKASQDADFKMMEFFDKNPGSFIIVKDVLLHNVELLVTDEKGIETGEIRTATRCVLIDTNGMTYSSVSAGVLSSLQKIFALYGMPTWDEGLKIIARRVSTRRFQTINLSVVD